MHGFGRRPAAPETRDETRARVAAGVAAAGQLQLLRQVHGTEIVTAPCEGLPTADASQTTAPGVLLGIETADCLPVLFVDTRRRVAAAAHAGWRGTAAGIGPRVLSALLDAGSRLGDLRVGLGPGIGPCCYEFGEEMRAQFDEPDRVFFRPGPRGKPHLDVRGINRRQLLAAGVPEGAIESVDECTSCLPALYCSYRRDGPGTGRMISYVGWAADRP